MFRRGSQPAASRRRPSCRDHRSSLQLESLEARQLLAADVDVAGLLFRGDLVQDGQRWVVSSGAVDVGFKPTGSEAFRPLFTVTGGTAVDTIDTSVSFSGQGTISGRPFFDSSSMQPLALDIESLLGGGHFVAGSPFAWGGGIRGSTLKLVNPGGGDTSDTRIELSGAGTFSFGSATNGTTSPLALTDLVASLAPTGDGSATATASGVLYAAGSSWTLGGSSLSAKLTSWTATAAVAGSASVTIDGDPFTATFTGDGLQVTQSAFAGLTATLDGTFTPGGASVAGNAWTTTWASGSIGITGSGTLDFGAENTADLPGDIVAELGSRHAGTQLDVNLDNDIQYRYTGWKLYAVPGGTHPGANYLESVIRSVTGDTLLKSPNELASTSPVLDGVASDQGSDARNDLFDNRNALGGGGNDLFRYSVAGSYTADGGAGNDVYVIKNYGISLTIDGATQSGHDMLLIDVDRSTIQTSYLDANADGVIDRAVFTISSQDATMSSSITVEGWNQFKLSSIARVDKPDDNKWNVTYLQV